MSRRVIYLPRLEVGFILIGLQVDQGREQEDHVAALIHNGGMAERAADLARQLVLDGFLGRIVPLQVVVAIGEVDVLLVEDGSPLEWCRMLGLASSAVAKLAVKGLYAGKLVLDLATMAIGLVLGIELVVGLVDPIRGAALPLANASCRLAAALIFVHVFVEVVAMS